MGGHRQGSEGQIQVLCVHTSACTLLGVCELLSPKRPDLLSDTLSRGWDGRAEQHWPSLCPRPPPHLIQFGLNLHHICLYLIDGGPATRTGGWDQLQPAVLTGGQTWALSPLAPPQEGLPWKEASRKLRLGEVITLSWGQAGLDPGSATLEPSSTQHPPGRGLAGDDTLCPNETDAPGIRGWEGRG